MKIEFGIYLNGIDVSYLQMRELWIAAENSGFDYIWMMDNVVGPVPYEATVPVLETWSVLPALAEATKTVKFGTLCTPYGRRRAPLLAKMISILDHVSEGRFNLGIGPGDEPRQHEPWGQEYPKPAERIAILREELTIITRMMTEQSVTFEGKYYTLHDAVNEPKPLQKPYPPIWIGLVFGKQLMPKIAAQFADGINVYNGQDIFAFELLDLVRQRCAEIGRDFDRLKTSRNIGVYLTDEHFNYDSYIRECAARSNMPLIEMQEYYRAYECLAAGDDEAVAQKIYASTIKLGFAQPVINFGGGMGAPEMSKAERLRQMDRFMTVVAPRVRALAGEA